MQNRSYPLSKNARWLLLAIVAVYVLLGSLYAIETPAWQSPDEPAHYNYVAYIATTGQLPVLQLGDYPAEYLEELKAARFPAELSVDSIRYESHQPPLYYLVASPVFLLARAFDLNELLVLRLFSVLLESIALALGYLALYTLLKGRTLLTTLAMGLVALIPMHVALTAAVNSDVMAELMIALVAFYVIRGRGSWSTRRIVGLGLLLGLCALTKLQTYTAGAFAAFALYDEATEGSFRLKHISKRWWAWFALTIVVALAVLAPWLVHNGLTYGWNDLLGLHRHDTVVLGQLTTADYLAANGGWALLRAFCTTTFHSFWGQFGWMGVVLDRRIYQLFGLFCLIALSGMILGWRRKRRAGTHFDGYALGLLSVWLLVTTLGYLWWNLSYVQHQGRYLFPALLPICVGLAWGWEQALVVVEETQRRGAYGKVIQGFICGAISGLFSWLANVLSRFDIALLAGSMVGLPTLAYLRRRLGAMIWGVVWAGLALLDIYILYRQILPALI